MLYGVDLSDHNYVSSVRYASYAFVICKATEGVSFDAKTFRAHMANASANGQLLGAYHYARPEYNTAEAEAEHFLARFKPFIGKAVPALDWEQMALKYPVKWALRWLQIVEQATGCKPLFYVQQSQACLKKFKIIADAGYPIWLAQYSKHMGATVWPKVTIWQYTSIPYDKNVFYGERADWYRLIRPEEKDEQKGRVPIVGVTKQGMKGVQVKGLQEMLKGYGYYNATVDGDFGIKTAEAVKNFQRAEGLTVDAIVGQKTWNRLAGLE